MTMVLRAKPLSDVVRGIIKRDNGCWLDASDLSTMYQDAAGTIPVTAMEQPVGKWLDKSGNGNHATQSITASRPVVSARKNLLVKTEDFADAAWTKNAVTVVADAIISPAGTISADAIKDTVTLGRHRLQTSVSIINGVQYTVSVYARYEGVRYLVLNGNAAFNALCTFDIMNGAVSSTTTGTGRIENIGGGWFRCSVTGTATATANSPLFIGFNNYPLDSDYTGTGATCGYIWGAQLEYGPAATRYQRVNTATDYDTAGFPAYLKFDGVDDYMSLPYMGLYANGSASAVTASALLRQATDAYTISEGNTADADSLYCMTRQLASGGNLDSVIVRNDATVLLDTAGTASALADGVASVRDFVDTGSGIKLFKNSGQLTSDTYTRSGAVTLNNTTIGAKVGTAAALFNNLMLYGLIITKSALSDADRRKCEVYLGRKAGVQL